MEKKFKKQDVFNPEKFTYLDQDEARILNEMTPLELRKGEKIYNLVCHYLFLAISLMFIILAICYVCLSSNNFSTDGNSGFGVLGLCFYILTCLAWVGFSYIGYRFHSSYDKKVDEKLERLHFASYFIFIPLILTTIFLIPLRSAVLDQYAKNHSYYGYRGWESYFCLALVWVIAIVLYVLNWKASSAKMKKALKITNFCVLATAFYLPLFFLPILQLTYSASYYGSYLMIFAPIIIDIGLVVGLFSNSARGTHSAYHTILNIGVMMELLCLVFYAMNNVSNVA